MKHFIDIQNARLVATDLVEANTGLFEVGDHIQITEKIDGSNAQIKYENGELKAFSRKQELTYSNTLNGFWNYVTQELVNNEKLIALLKEHSSWCVFGEWNLCGNKIKDYKPQYRKKWIIYDIYDREETQWLTQDMVKMFCTVCGLEYIHILYEGEFISWEHCQTFLHKNTYGPTQEGIVIKLQSKMNDENTRKPFYLKIVNKEFSEKINRVKIVDPAKESEKANALALAETIVTKRRVEKGLEKLRDESIIPDKLTPEDMKTVAKNLPKYIYDDCIKEEIETVRACGEYFSKACSSLTMKYAKEIILGNS